MRQHLDRDSSCHVITILCGVDREIVTSEIRARVTEVMANIFKPSE